MNKQNPPRKQNRRHQHLLVMYLVEKQCVLRFLPPRTEEFAPRTSGYPKNEKAKTRTYLQNILLM